MYASDFYICIYALLEWCIHSTEKRDHQWWNVRARGNIIFVYIYYESARGTPPPRTSRIPIYIPYYIYIYITFLYTYANIYDVCIYSDILNYITYMWTVRIFLLGRLHIHCVVSLSRSRRKMYTNPTRTSASKVVNARSYYCDIRNSLLKLSSLSRASKIYRSHIRILTHMARTPRTHTYATRCGTP